MVTIGERPGGRRQRRPGLGPGDGLILARRATPVGSVSAPTEESLLRDRVAAGARSLARQVRALQERYEEEHRRLADTLEFLAVQSRDLEQELAAFGRLAESLEAGPAIPPTPPSSRREQAGVAGSGVTDREAAHELEVRCLGGFEVRYRGQPVDLGTSRKGRLVFKYLLVRAPARRASKELLAELFWPDLPLERALPSLHSAIHQLKQAMARSEAALWADPALVFADDHYGLNPRLALRSDVDAFRRRLATARVQDAQGQVEAACRAYWLAAEAYGGELLPEERYEDWLAGERASLEADQAAGLTRLVQLNLARGAHREAVQAGRMLLALDSTREDVHRDVMRAYSRLGQRTEVLRQYRRCFEALQAELDLEPEPETTQLFERAAGGETI